MPNSEKPARIYRNPFPFQLLKKKLNLRLDNLHDQKLLNLLRAFEHSIQNLQGHTVCSTILDVK